MFRISCLNFKNFVGPFEVFLFMFGICIDDNFLSNIEERYWINNIDLLKESFSMFTMVIFGLKVNLQEFIEKIKNNLDI